MRRKTKAKRVLDYENEEQDEKEEQKLDVRYIMESFWVFFVPLFCLFVAVTWNIVSNERVIRMTRAACPTARAAETEETNGCCQRATGGEFSSSSRGAPEVGHEGLGFFLTDNYSVYFPFRDYYCRLTQATLYFFSLWLPECSDKTVF